MTRPRPDAQQGATGAPHRLSRRAARVLYNVADAWLPPGCSAAPGAPGIDGLPALERRLSAAARWRLELALLLLEWEPRLGLRSRRGFAWQPRESRRALLERWAGARRGLRRRLARELRERIEVAWREASQSRDGA